MKYRSRSAKKEQLPFLLQNPKILRKLQICPFALIYNTMQEKISCIIKNSLSSINKFKICMSFQEGFYTQPNVHIS